MIRTTIRTGSTEVLVEADIHGLDQLADNIRTLAADVRTDPAEQYDDLVVQDRGPDPDDTEGIAQLPRLVVRHRDFPVRGANDLPDYLR